VTQLSVVVPSCNTKSYLRACLQSLMQTLPMSSEVIVVDDASRDGSARMVADSFPHVRLVRNSARQGITAAMNQGFRAARGAYVLFLQADTQIQGRRSSRC
jgi:glycosyltransferase involved in cell wall biosynthesis